MTPNMTPNMTPKVPPLVMFTNASECDKFRDFGVRGDNGGSSVGKADHRAVVSEFWEGRAGQAEFYIIWIILMGIVALGNWCLLHSVV